MRQVEGGWERVCPKCKSEVIHKTRAKCRLAESKDKMCSACNRSAIGKANSRSAICPICFVNIKISRTSIGQAVLVEHAALHDLSPDKLWRLHHGLEDPPRCKCGCGKITAWRGWWEGYSAFVIGHNARVETPEEKSTRLAALRDSFSSGMNVGWSKGLTKDTDQRVRARAEATSTGRKKAFDEGRINAWSKGLTKDTDQRVKELSDALTEVYARGEAVPWAKGLSKDTDVRVKAMAAKVSLTHQTSALREHLDGLKRLSVDEIKERVERGGLLSLVCIEGEYTNYLQPNVVVRCNKCQTTWNDTVKRLDTCRCYVCDPAGSRAQTEIAEWMRGFRANVHTNDRTRIGGLELDVFDVDARIAVEYNGHYWHNITKKSSSYHQNKTDRCADAGITLFHVFEDEWRDKRPIVKSMLRHRLSSSTRVVNARDCVLRILAAEERKCFFEANHIDGDVKASVAYGLLYDGDIVAAMSLRAPFHKRYAAFTEVARTCSALNTNVRGGVSRLTKAVKNHVANSTRSQLMTYVDTRFGGHMSWSQAGWNIQSETAIRWWWTDNHDRFNRFQYRADPERGMTEDEVAVEAGVVKIYGCKNKLYVLP